MKPMLAEDAVESKIRFPVYAQPKIDGVRSVCPDAILRGRSLKQHANRYVTNFFSRVILEGLDGEMAAESETHPDLCRITTSALNTIDGQPFTLWWLFDYIREDLQGYPYKHRLFLLQQRYEQIKTYDPEIANRLRLVPTIEVNSLPELLSLEDQWLEQGYEGVIIRDPNGLHKQGRSTVREGGLLRIKRFIDAEAVVVSIIEGETNNNEAKLNELGHTSRSTHQANMVPNGMVGAMMCRLIKDVKDSRGNVLFQKGEEIKVGAGRMSHKDREFYFQNPDKLIGQIIKFKLFPKGVKDKPRFPTYQSIRMKSDL